MTYPDLVVTSVSGPTSAITLQSISVSNTVQNQGGAASGNFSIGIYLSTDPAITTGDILIGTRTASLAANGVSAISTTVTIPASIASGTYYIGAIADSAGVVQESNETNNSLAGNQITVTPGADLVVTSVSGPVSGGSGQTITINSVVKNQGIGMSQGFSGGYYLSTDANITT
ncbi:MAG: peptidase, partial [Nitrospirae bacterium]|nr:peptidase [Nitrospirota bacterium]